MGGGLAGLGAAPGGRGGAEKGGGGSGGVPPTGRAVPGG